MRSMAALSKITPDQAWLRAFAKCPSAENAQPIVDRYLPLVYTAARRQTGNSEAAADAARAVFAVFARRARKLSKRTVLAPWFHRVTRIVCRKQARRSSLISWFKRGR